MFVVVHRKLPSFRGDAQVTSWLYGICLRVASSQHRRRRVLREQDLQELEELPSIDLESPEDDIMVRQRRRVLEQLLDDLSIEKRALFVMFEIDELPCEKIAHVLGVPVGTVYSRLHAARKAFSAAVARYRARTKGAKP